MKQGAPKRWLDDVGVGLSGERDVLRSGLNIEPPPGEKDAVWAAIFGGLPPGGGAAGGGAGKALAGKGVSGAAKAASAAAKASALAKAGGATATLAGGGLVKSALIGAGSAAILVGAYTAVGPPMDEPPPPQQVMSMPNIRPRLDLSSPGLRAVMGHAPPPVATSEIDVLWPPPEEATSARGADARPPLRSPSGAASPVSEPVPRSTMIEASDALTAARATLRAGNASGALAQLETMRVRFPADLLGEEREALTIESLQFVDRDGARARKEAFLRTNPNSIHAARVQTFAR